MSFRVRDWTPEDYAATVAVSHRVYPDYPQSVEEWRFRDEKRPPHCRHQRWVVESEGGLVAFADYSQPLYAYHPRRFWMEMNVDPEHERRGIGGALYSRLLEALAPHDPLAITTHVREDHPRSLRFLEKRGFTERMREWESRLDAQAFDAAPFAEAEARMGREGIRILTLRELESDSGRDRKLHALANVLEEDVPTTEKATPLAFEEFVRGRLENPDLLPDGWFVALDGDRYVGYSSLWNNSGGRILYVGLTGVLREHRRRGIALALKVRTARYAKESGAEEVRTWNATTNEGMLGINIRLGFRRQPAWLCCTCDLPGCGAESGAEPASRS